MRFGDFDNYRHDYDEGPDAPEGYIPAEGAFEYVFENERDAVDERVKAEAALEWLKTGQPWLDLLNIVSRHDKEQLKEAIRQEIDGARQSDPERIAEPQLFAVASDAARLLESVGSPHSNFCTPSEDLAWANGLIRLTRAFREILFLLSEPDDSWMVNYHLARPVKEVNAALLEGRPDLLEWHASNSKTRAFRREVHTETTPLHSHLAKWIRDFLVVHRSSLALGACTECGTIFARERRDNVYCSKTCQNRVAYKRKKIFESGLLAEVKIDPYAPSGVAPGLWINHPRLGLGRIEAARFSERTLWLQFEGHGFGQRIPGESTAEQYLDVLKKNLKEKVVSWEEVVDRRSLELRVRFIQLSRSLRAGEIFPIAGKPDSIALFYRVTDVVALADLL
jgi:hypothetical protein